MRRFAALIVVLSLAASACSAGARQVARVGDTVISEQDIAALYVDESAPVDDTLRSLIFLMVARSVLEDALVEQFGAGVDPADVEATYQDLVSQMTAAGQTPAEFFQQDGVGDGMTHFQAELTTIYRTAVRDLVAQPDYIDGLFANPLPITTVCAMHILVGTEEEAQAVKARLEAGEDFATVANEVSTDTATPGGDLGCNFASLYVEPFGSNSLTAPLGELTGPFETSFGWHLMIVSDRSAPTREEVLADPFTKLPSRETTPLWQTWYTETLQAASVDLDAKYGTWMGTSIEAPTTAP